MSASTMKQELPERKKVKKKMSKAQMQLAIIKKKQCDAKALAIVEQLLEPNVDAQWLLCNLGYINKSHMEDVIEERAILKLCGYVLCNKVLTVVIRQQYHISTKKNKVYDVTRRKNFCSSRCYGACNYLLEQMFTSPLWLREQEEIPTFRFLPAQDELRRSTPGDEIHVGGTDAALDLNNKEQLVQPGVTSQDIGNVTINTSAKSNVYKEPNATENSKITDEQNMQSNIPDTSDVIEITKNHDESHPKDMSVNLGDTNSNTEQHISDDDTTCINEYINQNEEKNNIESNKVDNTKLCETLQSEYDASIIDAQNPKVTSEIDVNHMQYALKNKQKKHKKGKQRDHIKSEQQPSEFYTLAMHIEKNVREWVTEDTFCLLSGEEITKNRLLESVTQHDKYLQLCKKLNKLQLEDEKDEREDLTKSTLKPLPHLSILKEEGKKMELKVRAFYKGDMVIESPGNGRKDTEQNNDSTTVLPLIDAHAPKAVRRRIFLDKLNRILPDLLRALAASRQPKCTYSSERSALIKALVNTFSLSAGNIIFKTAEWTLVGLIIIKMLSIIDPQLKVLLTTRQASMYIAMILMSYKLDSNYLDRLIIELTNNPKIFSTDCNTSH